MLRRGVLTRDQQRARARKATGKIGTGAPPRMAVHHSADFSCVRA